MRIGADGSWTRWHPTGLGTYLDGLLRGIAAQLDGDELIVYYNSTTGRPSFGGGVRERFIRLPNRTLWNQGRLPLEIRRDRCDVYLGGAFVVPALLPVPRVAVVHDFLAFRQPSSKPGPEGRYWRRWTRSATTRARRVIADSLSTAADCTTYLGVPRDRIDVIHPGIGPEFLAGDSGDLTGARRLLAEHGIDSGTYMLQVGAFDAHKGGRVAMETAALLRSRGREVPLVQCGPGAPPERPATGHARLGVVSDDILRALYTLAAVVIVASDHEGFGFPVLEAMALGTPVVASHAGALPETGGNAALYASAGDPGSFADAVERLLSQPSEIRDRTEAGLRRASAFTWERAGAQVLAVLREAAG